ncbi:MAG TPA: glycosyltransferase [Candidatus Saccharimonadales bacterium]|nr:glycosyltransferase [Candidatus Saccharimonadales bacterium]
MTRILMIADSADPTVQIGYERFGGMTIYIQNLATELVKSNIQVDVYTLWEGQGGNQVIEDGPNLRYIRIPTDRTHSFHQGITSYVASQNLKYDIVHSNFYIAGIAGIEVAKKLKLPHVYVYHAYGIAKLNVLNDLGIENTDMSLQKRIEAELAIAKRVKNIIATSPVEKATLEKLYKIERNNMTIIPLGVDTKLFNPTSTKRARQLLNLQKDHKILLFVGRIDERKGLKTLFKSFKLIQKGTKMHLLIVGGNISYINQLKKLAKKLEIENKISYIGLVDQKELPIYYSAADVCVVPSYYEPFGIVPLEAMACGTPVVASKTGGLKFTIEEDKTGYLAIPGNAEDLAQKLEKALKCGKKYFQQNCLKRIDDNFLWNQIAREYQLYYQQTIDMFKFEQARRQKTGIKPISPLAPYQINKQN